MSYCCRGRHGSCRGLDPSHQISADAAAHLHSESSKERAPAFSSHTIHTLPCQKTQDTNG